MQSFEYRVVPAPKRGVKAKGARLPEDRFALAVEGEMNRMARDGWEFVRSDTLPAEERRGLFSRQETVPRTLLVFRRPFAASATAPVTMPHSMPSAMPLAAPAAVAPPLAAPVSPSRPAYLASTLSPAAPPTAATPPEGSGEAAELTRQMWHGTTFRRSPAPPAPISDPRLVAK